MITILKILAYIVPVGAIFIFSSSLSMHGYSIFPILCIAAITLALISSIKLTKKDAKNEIKNYLTISVYICLAIFISDLNVIHINYNRSMPSSRACLKKQREIQTAIEMYNMDNPEMIRTFNKSVLSKLFKEGYLKDEICCPENPAGEYSGKDLDKDGIINCSRHGSVREPVIDPFLSEKLMAKEREEKIATMFKYTIIVCFFMILFSKLLHLAQLYNKEKKKTVEETENDE